MSYLYPPNNVFVVVSFIHSFMYYFILQKILQDL